MTLQLGLEGWPGCHHHWHCYLSTGWNHNHFRIVNHNHCSNKVRDRPSTSCISNARDCQGPRHAHLLLPDQRQQVGWSHWVCCIPPGIYNQQGWLQFWSSDSVVIGSRTLLVAFTSNKFLPDGPRMCFWHLDLAASKANQSKRGATSLSEPLCSSNNYITTKLVFLSGIPYLLGSIVYLSQGYQGILLTPSWLRPSLRLVPEQRVATRFATFIHTQVVAEYLQYIDR